MDRMIGLQLENGMNSDNNALGSEALDISNEIEADLGSFCSL
jgi:hypothetical protein